MTVGSLKRKGALLLLAAAMGAVTWYFGDQAWNGYRRTVLAGDWIETKAVVTGTSRDDAPAEPSSPRDRPSVTAVVTYKYAVDGAEHTGEVRKEDLTAADADAFLAKYAPTGRGNRQKAREFNVFRNPGDPAETVLDREFSTWTIFHTAIALFAGLGTLGLLHALTERSGADGKPTKKAKDDPAESKG